MKQTLRNWLSVFGLASALALGVGGCGGLGSRSEDGGNTNWLKRCASDAECGELTCFCGSCRSACAGAVDCSLAPEVSCVADTRGAQAEAPRTLLEHRNPDSYASELLRLPDGHLWLVGGSKSPGSVGGGPEGESYPTFWLTRLDASGVVELTYAGSPTPQDELGAGRSLALTADGWLITLSTTYDGTDRPELRRFNAENGAWLAGWSNTPGFTLVRRAPAASLSERLGDDLFAAGSELIESRAGRPFTSAWIGRVYGTTTIWQQTREGVDGSVSNIVSLDSNEEGDVVVGGSLGTAPDSNESVPWLARLDRNGNWLWEHSIDVVDRQHCSATAAVLTLAGDSLGAGYCAGQWLRAYSESGVLRWERRFPLLPTALAALPDGGYAVGFQTRELASAEASLSAVLQRFDAEHRLLWQVELPDCRSFHRLLSTENGLLALAGCEPGFALFEYADP